MAHGRVLWLNAMTHEGERIIIINIHQATARRLDLQRRVNTHIQAEMNQKGCEEYGRGAECGNVAYRIFHLEKVSF